MKRNKGHELNEAFILRKVFRFNYLVMLMGIFVAMSGMVVDSILISRFMNENAIASYGVIMTVFISLNAFSGLLSAGGQAVIGRRLGSGEIDEANRLNSVLNKCTIALAVILIVLTLVFRNGILSVLGCPESSGELFVMSRDYLLGLVIGYPAILWTAVFGGFLPMDSDAKRSFLATIAMTIVNIACDLINIFVLRWGMFGMALATSVSYYVSAALILPHFFSRSFSLRLFAKGSSLSELPDVLKAGLPTGVLRAAGAAKFAGLNLILFGIASASAVASLTVGKSGYNIYQALSLAMGMTVLMMGSALVGEEDNRTLELILRTMAKYCTGPVLIITVMMLLLAKPLTGLFLTADSPAFADALMCNICMMLSLPLNALNVGMANYMQSIGKIKSSMVCNIMDNGGMLLICALIMSAAWGVKGVWLAFPVSELLVSLGVFVYAWVHQKRMPRGISDFLFTEEGFGVPESDELRSTLTDLESVVSFSEDVRRFCLKRGFTERTSMLMALCVEEMCGNIIEHGFVPDKESTIDARMFCKDGGITLRVRDDCRPFDPKQRYEMYREKGDFSNYGIKMIVEMTKDMRYVNLMKLNILYMEV